MGIHILGASGSGTTTLGAALAALNTMVHLDTDDWYWATKYTTPRAIPERLAGITAAMDQAEAQGKDWVLTGSLSGWGDPLIPRFDLVVFLFLPPELRLQRLEAREAGRYGDAILPGASRWQEHLDFMAWCEGYDRPDARTVQTGRNLARHRAWLAALPCPVLCIEGDVEVEAKVAMVLGAIKDRGEVPPSSSPGAGAPQG